ncbi:MAG: hypothetical protein AAB538_00675 [Patescibacteria group bacterium]
MINERCSNLLCGLVKEYIRTAEPLSSVYLKRILELSVSPATVRAWLNDLEDEGYIEQPHTSAGRVPTDSGYRHYVDRVRPGGNRRTEIEENPQTLVRYLSRAAHALAVAALPSGRVEQYGLLELMLQPEGSNRYAIQEISSILDHIHHYVEEVAEQGSAHTSVFIGSENPFMTAVHTSMLVKSVADREGRHSVVMLIGPKRMSYSQNISLLERVGAILG